MSQDIEQLPFPDSVKCARCNKYVSKYVCTYVASHEIEDDRDLTVFDEILCPNCKESK